MVLLVHNLTTLLHFYEIKWEGGSRGLRREGGRVGIREEEFGREWEGEGGTKWEKSTGSSITGGGRPAKLGEI